MQVEREVYGKGRSRIRDMISYIMKDIHREDHDSVPLDTMFPKA